MKQKNVSRWAMRQPLKKTPEKVIVPPASKKYNNNKNKKSKYVHLSRARPKSAHPSSRSRSRSNTFDTQHSSTMSTTSSVSSSRQSTSRRHRGMRPSSAPAYRGRKKETPFEKQLKLAAKQANLMRLIMVESKRNKELTTRMNETKQKLRKVRLKLKSKARKELLNSRNASAELDKKALKRIAIWEENVATLRRRRSQLEILTKKEKKKVDGLRIYSMTLETTVGCFCYTI